LALQSEDLYVSKPHYQVISVRNSSLFDDLYGRRPTLENETWKISTASTCVLIKNELRSGNR